MKTHSQQIFPARRTMYFFQLLETNLLLETTVSQAQPTLICLNSAILTVEQGAKHVQS